MLPTCPERQPWIRVLPSSPGVELEVTVLTHTLTDTSLFSSLLTEKTGKVKNLLDFWYEIRGATIIRAASLKSWCFGHVSEMSRLLCPLPHPWNKLRSTYHGFCELKRWDLMQRRYLLGVVTSGWYFFHVRSEGNLCLYCCLEQIIALPSNESNKSSHSLYAAELREAYKYSTLGGMIVFRISPFISWHKCVWWPYSFKLNIILNY